jgi:hypothetical protein
VLFYVVQERRVEEEISLSWERMVIGGGGGGYRYKVYLRTKSKKGCSSQIENSIAFIQ